MVGKETKFAGKILSTLIRIVGDFVVFWLIFLWNDGLVWERISAIAHGVGFGAWIGGIWELIEALVGWIWHMICVMMVNLWQWLVFLSPYSREAALDPRFLYCLHWCSGVAALAAVMFIYILADDGGIGIIPCVLLGLLAGVVTWYAGFGICFLLVKLTSYFHILAAFFAVLACVLVAVVLLGLYIWLMDLL